MQLSIFWKRLRKSRAFPSENPNEVGFLPSTRRTMRPEGGVRQRGLVDRRIVFSDAERDVSYVFPFVDRRWRVPFVVVALSVGAPLALDGPFRVDQFRFRTALRTNDLRRIDSRSEEHTSELQSRSDLVCRLL